MDEALTWGLQNERRVFGPELWDSHAQADCLVAFECIVRAAEEARKYSDDPGKQRAVLIRKSRNLFRDHLRRVYGVTKNKEGRRVRRVNVAYDSSELDDLASAGHEALVTHQEFALAAMDPAAVHAALREHFSDDAVRLFELVVTGLSSQAIGAELHLAPATVRKRWERLRPAMAHQIAEVAGLEEYYVARLLGARGRGRKSAGGGDKGRTE